MENNKERGQAVSDALYSGGFLRFGSVWCGRCGQDRRHRLLTDVFCRKKP